MSFYSLTFLLLTAVSKEFPELLVARLPWPVSAVVARDMCGLLWASAGQLDGHSWTGDSSVLTQTHTVC